MSDAEKSKVRCIKLKSTHTHTHIDEAKRVKFSWNYCLI